MSINIQAAMHAVESISSFFLIGLLGYFLTKRRWFTDESSSMLSRLLIVVIIPVNLVYNIDGSTTGEEFFPVLHHVFVPVMAVLLTIVLCKAIAHLINMPRLHRNIFAVSSACSSTINIGIPINLALFGTESIPAVLIYYIGTTTVFWTVGNYLLASDAPGELRPPVLSKATVRRIFSPPILGGMFAMLLLLLDVKIPPMVNIAAGQLSGMTAPLCVLCIGIALYQTGLANIKLTRDVLLVALGRFVISPLLLLGLLHFFPVPELMRNVFVIQATLPPITNIPLLAIQYKSDTGYAAVAVSFSTLCALVTVPLFMTLLSGM